MKSNRWTARNGRRRPDRDGEALQTGASDRWPAPTVQTSGLAEYCFGCYVGHLSRVPRPSSRVLMKVHSARSTLVSNSMQPEGGKSVLLPEHPGFVANRTSFCYSNMIRKKRARASAQRTSEVVHGHLMSPQIDRRHLRSSGALVRRNQDVGPYHQRSR